MKVLRRPSDMRAWRDRLAPRRSIGFVPTMGALHAGHFSLVARSLRENEQTVVSIFVNPTQFGPREDFSSYPRPLKRDVAALKKLGVDFLFLPTPSSLYPPGEPVWVTVEGLTDTLCGAPTSRGPGHFRGVATVVAKLFNAVRPTRAYFGMKDFQQLRILERMNEALNFGVRIVRCPTVRAAGGLALSSRNSTLSPREKALAPKLYLALQQGRKLLRSRHQMTPSQVLKKVRSFLSSVPGLKIEYIEMVHPKTLQPVRARTLPVLLAVAVRLGRTRLIDNILIS